MYTGLIEELKSRITCPDYMQREHGSRIIGGRCARPGHHNPSTMMVNERDWFDFASGKGGDIIDLAAEDKFAGDKGKAIRYLAENWGIRLDREAPQIEVQFRTYLAILDKAAEFYHSRLKPEHINYLHGRGITDKTIEELRIGWSDNPSDYLKEQGYTQEEITESGLNAFLNRIMIPYLRNGRATYFAGRESVWPEFPSDHSDAKYIKLKRTNLSEHPIWGMETLRRPGTVIVAEGIFDAISCYQEGYPVVTAVTGAFSAEQKKDLFPSLRGRDVLVCMDFDPDTHAGQKFTANLANELFEQGLHVMACFLSGDKGKVDLSSLYAMDPCRDTLEKAFAAAEPWERVKLHEIVSEENENERKNALVKFLRRCMKVFDWPTVAQLVADAREMQVFPEEWLKELKKLLKSPPSELDIVKEFKEQFDVVFHESLGWYEYAETVWERKSEFEIKQRIAELYGNARTAKNVEAVFKLLKAELVRTELFNTHAELINFPNGMFNLETGEMQPHSRDYYSSIQMAYPYNKDAECKEWNTFVEDVTAGETTRHNLLQEMFGYCLTKDVRYQKCFCLIGNGANGKSVLLALLEAMVGKANTSHVEVAYLMSDFQRIDLLSSMVNICNDMKSDVTGTDSFLKSIVAGDPIKACYKGKDHVTFCPVCKMVFSANRMLTTRDVDYSLLRRFCFINFPVTFVDDVIDTKTQKKKDVKITEKLLEELPGIFNWAYGGLKQLREQGYFTTPPEQDQMEHDMVSINNPLIGFVEDVIGNGARHWDQTLTRKEVYEEYSKWCRETNTMPMSARSFWPRLRQIKPYEELRLADGRCIRFLSPASKSVQ